MNISYYTVLILHAVSCHPLFGLNEINYKNLFKLFNSFFDYATKERFVENASVMLYLLENMKDHVPIVN